MSVDFSEVADYYDAMYVDPAGYEKECSQVVELVQEYGHGDGRLLLDIACGTGEQARYLSRHFQVVGFDLSERMIELARKKVADGEFQAEFHVADMCAFDLTQDSNRQFDAVVNLYGSIGFAENFAGMKDAVQAAYRHLKPGGVFLLTPWSTRETFREQLFSTANYNAGLHFCRMEVLRKLSDEKIRVEMHHLIGKDLDVRSFRHEQTISLFGEAEYVSALESAGFEIVTRLGAEQFRMGVFVCTK